MSNNKNNYYNSALLERAYKLQNKNARAFYKTSSITPATVRAAFRGESMQLAKLKQLAVALRVEWTELFNIGENK